MISTCVHCKKEFEWDRRASRICVIECCHCNKLLYFDGDSPVGPIKSKPLQVAKKWVVIKNDGMWIGHSGFMVCSEDEAYKFNSMKDATKALDSWAEKFQSNNTGARLSVQEAPQ